MGLDHPAFHVEPRLRLQVVDVLSEIDLEDSFVLEEPDEPVSESGLELAGVEKLFRKLVKGLWLLLEEL
eukprot:CAMPEP_0170508900 /NCGR_PEP_ID=MMETSP0208-20121228/63778_1 /TAXON_ID=197538 /ORGANISM="Strombidium inclinatum, Strain S3" /LENGTH=68 /DNA_ID=CAMNT_0010792057 /DNA_START=441 /DNA_END=647 /DNA_ORIENTATION=+